MVKTRSTDKKIMEEFAKLMDKKLDDFKASFMDELKTQLSQIMESKKIEFNEFISQKKVEFDTLSQDLEAAHSLEVIRQHVKELKDEVKELKVFNNELKIFNKVVLNELDDVKQYTRRTNLRLYGVPTKSGETSKDVLEIVEKLCNEVSPELFKFGSPIDRAHRIGRSKVGKDGVTTQPIIFRFLTFRNRTLIYRARKDIRKKYNYGISLDLTPARLKLLNKARELVDGEQGIQFVYSDINCYTRALLKNGEHKIFNSISDLDRIIAEL